MSQTPAKIAADILRLVDAPLFDTGWYAATYGGALADGGVPLVHFCNSGWANGLNPNPVFDTVYYLAANPDVREAAINPLLHYIDYGEAQDRRPVDYFDPAWYRAAQQVPAEQNCLANYLARRSAGAVATNAGFDPAWYRAEYGLPDDTDAYEAYARQGAAAGHDGSAEMRLIRQSGLFDAGFYQRVNPADPETDPLYHFCNIGWRKGYRPNALFDTAWYIAAYPEVAAADVNPLTHYIQYGEYEGRRPSLAFDPVAHRESHEVPPFVSSLGHRLQSPVADFVQPAVAAGTGPAAPSPRDEREVADSELFDINYYLANYPDVRESSLDPAAHFMTYGWMEGRRPNPYFDPAWYMKTYLPGARPPNPLLHYIRDGEAAGYRPVVYFDPAWYAAAHDLAPGEAPLRHYLQHRRGQRVSPTPLFDVDWYLTRHAAEIGRNRDAFAHYLRVGIAGNVDPGPDFDAAQYRLVNMARDIPPSRPAPGAEIIEKLRREAFNPLVHFLLNEATSGQATAFLVAG